MTDQEIMSNPILLDRLANSLKIWRNCLDESSYIEVTVLLAGPVVVKEARFKNTDRGRFASTGVA